MRWWRSCPRPVYLTTMVDALLLEWEGVLADTGGARRDSLLQALVAEGVRLDPADHDACCVGLDVAAAARAALARSGIADETLADLVAERAGRAFADRLAQGILLTAGAVAFMSAAAAGARVAIVTRATRAETDAVLRMAELEPLVSSVVCADDAPDIPHGPVLLEEALAHLGRRRSLRRNRVVSLTDTLHGIHAARAAALRVVAVGAPAHVALDADGAVDGVDGLTLQRLTALAGLAPAERRA